MEKPIINFEDFELPFIWNTDEEENDENSEFEEDEDEDEEEEEEEVDEELDNYEVKNNIEACIPDEAEFEEDEDYEEEDEMDEELDNYEVKYNMEACIPDEAEFIGGIDSELENWTTWVIKHDYYIIPLEEDSYDWALFRINWDDNYEKWGWSFDVRLRGFKNNKKEAIKYMLIKLWEKWKIDINEKGNEDYLHLFNRL